MILHKCRAKPTSNTLMKVVYGMGPRLQLKICYPSNVFLQQYTWLFKVYNYKTNIVLLLLARNGINEFCTELDQQRGYSLLIKIMESINMYLTTNHRSSYISTSQPQCFKQISVIWLLAFLAQQIMQRL